MKKSENISRLATPSLQNNYGQAVIEYTLLLVVSVSFVLALSMYIFKPFGEFVSNYMGKYVGCLLEYGELPTLGSDLPSGPDQDSECDKQFKAATIAQGRPPSSSSSSQTSNSKSNSNNNSSKTSSSSSANGSSNGTYAGSASRGGGSNIMGARRPTGSVESGSNVASGKVIEISLADNGSNNFFKGSSDGGYRRPAEKTRYVPMTGLMEEEQKKLLRKKENGGRTLVPSEGLSSSTKKTLVKKPPEKIVTKEEEPFTIGNFLRYLLIAAIIIALVIFIGGQALQMSKSFEK